MITGEIKIEANTYFDDCTAFDLTASRDALVVQVHFWDYANLFEQFGSQLANFPQNPTDKVEVEIGELIPGFSRSYLLLKAYCYDANGHAALKIVTHNNKTEPQTQRVEFSIPADIASLNTLGKLLRSWSPQGNAELVWQAQLS
jgi:hypothetical protein